MKCLNIIHKSGNNLGKVVPISFTILGITWEMCPYYSDSGNNLDKCSHTNQNSGKNLGEGFYIIHNAGNNL